ncbi:MAG: D-alanine--D-alanine ligase [Bacteroidota bacterium]|nr:D-alanine--D-alanine ligase [Bacteroidota bacterium]
MLTIAVVCGGYSGEFEISIQSGEQVYKNLDRSKYRPFLIEIRKDGWDCRWEGQKIPVNRENFSVDIPGATVCFDLIFSAIHGTPGEDGKLQGYFDLLGIPYTTCGSTTSSLTFNKSFCKGVASSLGYTTAKSVHLFRHTQNPSEIIRKNLSFPMFIKPNNGGSSVGMTKVHNEKELPEAIERAFHEDPEILAEEFIEGRELTCGVLRHEGKVIAFPVTEIISKKEFFDYEAKYKDGLSSEVVPADIPDNISNECRKISSELYDHFNCRGVVRFDYILKGNTFYFLEVNTIPGMTEQSIVPKMARAYGWTVRDLFTRLIEETLRNS